MKQLVIALEGHMMSFGAVAVDERRPTAQFPMKSMVVGILANALGHTRADARLTDELQRNIQIASRLDRSGVLTHDYQTVRMEDDGEGEGRSFCASKLWSGRHSVMGRESGSPTVQLYKEYLADASATVAISGDEELIAKLSEAVQRPARPIFLGRKGCLPSRELFVSMTEAQDVYEALEQTPIRCDGDTTSALVQWPSDLGQSSNGARLQQVSDLRNWAASMHTGTRSVYVAERDWRKS